MSPIPDGIMPRALETFGRDKVSITEVLSRTEAERGTEGHSLPSRTFKQKTTSC